jgi:hypothetical protein
MTGILAQIIALTAYGNDFLLNGRLPVDFFPGNTTFNFCNRVDFREFSNLEGHDNVQEIVIATNPVDWLIRIKNDGCKSIRLYFQNSKDQTKAKNYQLAGFVGGGGAWLAEVIYDGYSDYWANRWEGTDPDNADRKIWSVSYGLAAKRRRITNQQINEKEIKERLKQTLTDIANFAYGQDSGDWQDLSSWGKQFDKANFVLESENPERDYYQKGLIPIGNYSLTARQILFSAGSAWVFGGMGSWNEVGFNDKEIHKFYEKLSEQLYTNINDAVIAAINSY